jgi:hypothetical protein
MGRRPPDAQCPEDGSAVSGVYDPPSYYPTTKICAGLFEVQW